MFRALFRFRASAVLMALACAAAPVAQADAALEPCADASALQAAVERLNALRHAGASCTPAAGEALPLAWEARLASSAYEQAADLATRDVLSHVDARERAFDVRLRSAGYAAAGAGENLAAGQQDVEATLQAWLASPSHCANLLQPEFTDVGLACVQRRGSRYERFWVAHLGVPARR